VELLFCSRAFHSIFDYSFLTHATLVLGFHHDFNSPIIVEIQL
jgi:hypothetical protein